MRPYNLVVKTCWYNRSHQTAILLSSKGIRLWIYHGSANKNACLIWNMDFGSPELKLVKLKVITNTQTTYTHSCNFFRIPKVGPLQGILFKMVTKEMLQYTKGKWKKTSEYIYTFSFSKLILEFFQNIVLRMPVQLRGFWAGRKPYSLFCVSKQGYRQ